LPPADPTERQVIVSPSTRTWPSLLRPMARPSKATRASRASSARDDGQECPGLQLPSISRAAIPDKRMRGPSAPQAGPS
jgi:hypothetical protein